MCSLVRLWNRYCGTTDTRGRSLEGNFGMHEERRLASGERLLVDVLGPGEGRGATDRHLEIFNFLTQPFDFWMSPTETMLLSRILTGNADPSLADTLLVGRIDGAIAGAAWHATDADTGELGGYGFVLTDPAQRGKGVAQQLTGLAVQRFWDAGGQASYLGTVNPVAQHVYEKFGYASFNGLTMRALRPGLDAAAFDGEFFARAGAGGIRDVRLGDLAPFTALVMAHEPRDWIVRDYTESMFFAPPAVQATGCLRPFCNALARHETNAANAWKVLVNDRGRLTASANLWAPAVGARRDSAELEFQAVPAYVDRAAAVIEAVVDEAAGNGIRRVRACAASPARQAVLAAAGFEVDHVRAGDLDLGDRRADVTVLRRDLAG